MAAGVIAGSILAAAHAWGQSDAPPPPRLGGYLQMREAWQEPTGLTASLNRVRLSADGSLPHAFGYRVLVEYESATGPRTAAGVALRDAYVRWTHAPWSITAGQFKTPFSREYMTSITAIETADRSTVVDTLAPKRDVGVMGEWARPWGSAALGVFNGEGQNATLNRDSTLLVISRLAARPLAELAVAGSVAAYGDDSTRYGGEASIERSGVLLRGEVIGQHRHGRGRDDLGWFILGGWRIAPWLQIIARREDFQRPSLGVARRISATTAGANLDLPGGRTRLLTNFVSRATGSPRVTRQAWISQVQLRF